MYPNAQLLYAFLKKMTNVKVTSERRVLREILCTASHCLSRDNIKYNGNDVY